MFRKDSDRSRKAIDKLHQGSQYAREGDFYSALTELTRAIHLYPHLTQAYLERAKVFEQFGNDDDARLDREVADRLRLDISRAVSDLEKYMDRPSLNLVIRRLLQRERESGVMGNAIAGLEQQCLENEVVYSGTGWRKRRPIFIFGGGPVLGTTWEHNWEVPGEYHYREMSYFEELEGYFAATFFCVDGRWAAYVERPNVNKLSDQKIEIDARSGHISLSEYPERGNRVARVFRWEPPESQPECHNTFAVDSVDGKLVESNASHVSSPPDSDFEMFVKWGRTRTARDGAGVIDYNSTRDERRVLV